MHELYHDSIHRKNCQLFTLIFYYVIQHHRVELEIVKFPKSKNNLAKQLKVQPVELHDAPLEDEQQKEQQLLQLHLQLPQQKEQQRPLDRQLK